MTGIYNQVNNAKRCGIDTKMPYLSSIIWLRNKLRGNTYLVPETGGLEIDCVSEKCCHLGYGRPKRRWGWYNSEIR